MNAIKEQSTLDEEVAELEAELWNSPTGAPESLGQPQSVDNTIEFDKWLEDKKQRYLENKEECYNDILSSTTSAIDQFLKSPYQAQKGVLESAVKCNERFLEFVDNTIDIQEERKEASLIRKIKDYVLSLDTPDNEIYQNNSLLIQSCFAKALEFIEKDS